MLTFSPEERLREGIPASHLRVNGHATERLCNTLNVSLLGAPSKLLLKRLEDRVAASAGSACHSENVEQVN